MQRQSRTFLLLTLLALLSCSQALPCGRGEYKQGLLCLPCQKLPNMAADQTLANRCLCSQKYLWSSSSLRCQRAGNLQAVQVEGETARQEREARQLQTLSCNWAAGFILYTQPSSKQLCVHCSSFMFSTGFASSDTSCSCVAPTSWQERNGVFGCVCADSSNSLYLNGTKCEFCSKLPYDGIYPYCAYCYSKFAESMLGCVNCSAVAQATGTVTNRVCDCKTGYAFNYNSGKCECNWINLGYYLTAAGVCSPCSGVAANLKDSCNNCENEFFYFNGSYCIMASSVTGYNATTQACTNGQGFLKDVFSEGTLACGCSSMAPLYFFINGTVCQNCNSSSSTTACNSCSRAAGFFNSNGQCVFCKTLPKSDGTTTVTDQGCKCQATFFFNVSSAKCECDVSLGYYTLTNGSCFNCNSLANTSRASVGRCNCKPGFNWSGTACVCAAAAGGFNSSKGCSVCIGMVGSNETVLSTGCACILGYVWSTTNLRCECDTSKGYSVVLGVCKKCSLFAGTDGSASASGCGCLNSYFFVDGVCSCLSSSGFFVSESICANCSATLPTGVVKSSCTSCSNAAGFYLDKSTGQCIYCLSQTYATGQATDTGCKCYSGAVWSNFYKACVCDFYSGYNFDMVGGAIECTDCAMDQPCWDCNYSDGLWIDRQYAACAICPNFPNTVSGATSAGCNCKPGYIWNSKTYPFGCVCGFSNGGFQDGATCKVCLSGSTELIAGCKTCDLSKYFFLSLNGTCINCKTLANSNTAVLPTSAGCACKSGYKWSSNFLSCIPATAVVCSNRKVINMFTNACECMDPLMQDPNNANLCVCNPALNVGTLANGSCVDCGQVTDSNGKATGAACECILNLVWLPATGTCGCPANNAFIPSVGCFDCSSFEGSTLKEVNPNDPAACSCDGNQQFAYDYENLVGTCSCSAPYVPGQNGNCACEANAVDPDSSGICFSCVIANGPGTIDEGDSTKCACNSPFQFIWDSATSTGVCGCGTNFAVTASGCFDCSSLDSAYSPQTLSSDVAVCDCNSPYVFIVNSDGSALCGCGQPYLPTPEGDVCKCDTSVSIPKQDGTCFSCDIIHSTLTTDSADPPRCVCHEGFVFNWDDSTETGVCGCGPTAISSQETCLSCSSVTRSTGEVNPSAPGECACKEGFVFVMVLNVDTNEYTASCDCPTNTIIDETDPDNPICKCDPASALTKRDSSCFVCDITGGDGTTREGSEPLECTCTSGAFIWDSESQTGICDCPPPKVYSQDTKGCICDTVISVDVGGGECFDCRGLADATGETLRPDRQVCQCYEPFAFVWADSTNKSGSCQCSGPNHIFVDEVCFDCRIDFSKGTASADKTACNCKSPTSFVWNSETKTGECVCPDNKVFNPSKSKCICDSAYFITLSDNSCKSCQIPFNEAGTAKNKKECGCDKGYVFTAANHSCNCDTKTSIVPEEGVCYSCNDVDKSTKVPVSTTACKCSGSNLSFLWDTETKTGKCGCQEGWVLSGTTSSTWKCVCATNHILLAGKCFSCAIDNSPGTAKNGSVCNCYPGFAFNTTGNIPACKCDSKISIEAPSGKCFSCNFTNSMGVPLNATACKCVATFSWVWDEENEIGTCECPLPKKTVGKVCACPATSIPLTTAAQCLDCTTIPNSLKIVSSSNKSACSCAAAYMFVLDISTSTGSCVCKKGSYAVNETACFNCSNVKNNNGVVNSDSCGCKAPFKWIPENKTCSCDPDSSIISGSSCLICPGDAANGTGVPSGSVCGCIDGFTWNGKTCLCNSPLTYSADPKSCTCEAPYEIDGSNKCVCPPNTAVLNAKKVCISCSDVSNNEDGSTTKANSNICKCKAGFSWVANTTTCSCPSTAITNPQDPTACLNCDTKIFAKAKNGTGCSCQGTAGLLKWDTNAASCICGAANSVVQLIGSTYKCITCGNSVYASGKDTQTACTCSNDFMTWNSALGSCFCPANNILTSDFTCLQCPTTAIDKYHCNCPTGSIWNNIDNICKPCSQDPNASGTTTNIFVCKCKTNYYWNIMTLSCTLVNSTCSNTKATLPCMNCQSIPNTANTTPVNKNNAATINITTATNTVSLLGGTNTIYAKLTGFMCNCGVGFKWEPKLLRCYSTSISSL